MCNKLGIKREQKTKYMKKIGRESLSKVTQGEQMMQTYDVSIELRKSV